MKKVKELENNLIEEKEMKEKLEKEMREVKNQKLEDKNKKINKQLLIVLKN